MEFLILGSLEVHGDDGPIALGGAKPRGLLAILLLHANEPVSAERLAVALWGEDAPARSIKTVHVHVSRLRRALGDPEVVTTTPAGYRLRVRPGELDADRFERLVSEGRDALADGRPERAARTLREALSIWRGRALAEFAFDAFAQSEIGRLEEERLAALEARVEADMAVGRHGELVGELQQLVAAHALREQLHRQLMLALYRAGRQADALEAYRRARDVLVDQLGIEPGPELRALEAAILAQDPALDPERPPDRRAPAARIPAPPTATVGRAAELAGLSDLVGEAGGRLVTLVGPGGVGKTRLALELARGAGDRFDDGVHFVTLAPVSSHEHVASTIARQLDVLLMPSESAEEGLARHLSDRDALLVLDNFEHVLDAAPLVAELIAATTRLRVLVTSREPLRVRAEQLFRLDPLGLPDGNGDAAGVEDAPAVALFLAVARTQDSSFSLGEENARAIARVCRRLDGLPLAIELAGARIGLLTAPELADRLGEGLDALGTGPRDAPARQRTLAATLDWSYELLTPGEQSALTGLSAFAGGCTLDAAEAVTGAPLDVLEALVAKNLVVRRTLADGHTRLSLLETVGDFARERRDGDDIRRRHCDFYLALAERAAPRLERSDPPALIAELDREVHNLRAALAWALERHAALPALRLATALPEYWNRRDLGREGARWVRAALALPDDDVPVSVRAEALGAYAFCLTEADTVEEAEVAARESLALARSIGDVAQCSRSTLALAAAALSVHRVEDGYRHAAEAERLALQAGDEAKRDAARNSMAVMAPTLDESLALGEQLVAAYRRAGSARRLGQLQTDLTYTALFHGDLDAAERLAAEALGSAETLGDPHVLSFAYGNEGLVALYAGDVARAGKAFGRELRLADRYRYHRILYEAIHGLAAVAAGRGRDELAARLLGAAEITSHDRHDPVIARQIEERYFAPARARLGERAWHEAHAGGAALTVGDAVEAALRHPQVV